MTEKSRDLHLHYSSKGYALLFDAILAVIIFITLYSTLVAQTLHEQDTVGNLTAQKMIHDTLDLLDKRNALETNNANLITGLIHSGFPGHWKWQLTLYEYEYTQSQFNLVKESKMGLNLDMQTQEIHTGNRIFLTFKDGKIDKYYLAKLQVVIQ